MVAQRNNSVIFMVALVGVYSIVLLLASTCMAGDRANQRFVARARDVIRATPLPGDSNGAAFTRTLRINWIPWLPPLGGYLFGGRSAAFRLDENRQPVEPRVTRHAGGGLTASVGIGFPFSGSLSREVRAFRGAEYEQFTTRTYPQASLKLYAGVGLPGRSFVQARGPVWGAAPPGQFIHKREVFVGAFVSTGVSAEVRNQWPMRGRRR